MSRVDVVHYLSATEKSLPIVATLVEDLLDQGHQVRVIDLSVWSTISRAFPPQWILTLLGHKGDPQEFEKYLVGRGVEYLSVAALTPKDAKISASDRADIGQSIESELLTYLRRDSLTHSRAATVLKASLEKNSTNTYTALAALWKTSAPDLVCIPNGRTSRQKAARRSAEAIGIKVKLYENGRARPHSYYLGTTQPHDRLASQAEVESLTKKLKRHEIETLATEWLSSRMGERPGTNQFSSRWNDTAPSKKSASELAVFFASSFDEFLAFGPMWNIDSWSSQFDAFDRIMTMLEQEGVDMILRLHPNLASKSQKYFRREVGEVLELQRKHPTLTVIWHNSPVNSYALVNSADRVFVERSTIGLEACLLGKPVWVTQASQWDRVADIRQILSPDELTAEILKPWKPNITGAQKFTAYWMIQERPLRFEWSTWTTWNPDKPPFPIRLAHLAVKNPLVHKIHVISVTVSRWRNNQFRPPKSSHQKGRLGA